MNGRKILERQGSIRGKSREYHSRKMLIKQKALIRGNPKSRIIPYATPCRISLQGILQDIIVSILYDILQGILCGVP